MPASMRSWASAAWSSGIVSMIGFTPVCRAENTCPSPGTGTSRSTSSKGPARAGNLRRSQLCHFDPRQSMHASEGVDIDHRLGERRRRL